MKADTHIEETKTQRIKVFPVLILKILDDEQLAVYCIRKR